MSLNSSAIYNMVCPCRGIEALGRVCSLTNTLCPKWTSKFALCNPLTTKSWLAILICSFYFPCTGINRILDKFVILITFCWTAHCCYKRKLLASHFWELKGQGMDLHIKCLLLSTLNSQIICGTTVKIINDIILSYEIHLSLDLTLILVDTSFWNIEDQMSIG